MNTSATAPLISCRGIPKTRAVKLYSPAAAGEAAFKIKIGKNCCISQGVYFCTGNHDFKKESFDLISESIVVGDSVWIGAKSIIGPGSNILSESFLKLGTIYNKKN